MILCGIDPGLGGAISFVHSNGTLMHVADMPVFEVKRGKTKRRDLDGHSVLRMLEQWRPEHAFIEQAQAMPGQSAYATGIFFQVYGELRGLLIGLSIPLTVVAPVRWKKALGVPAEKDGARARASQLLPRAADAWPLKKHDGRAEATLIAVYGLRSLSQSPGLHIEVASLGGAEP